MSREEVKNKLSIEIEPLGFKVWNKKNKEEDTRKQSVKEIMKKSYLDFIITFGIDNYNFQILDKLVISDHKALSIEFLDDRKKKSNRIKELIEPYTIDANRLVELFNSKIAEVKLLRLLYDKTFNYKIKNRNLNLELKILKEQ